MTDGMPKIFRDAAAWRAACAGYVVIIPGGGESGAEWLERAVAMAEATGTEPLILPCNGRDLHHGEGEGCESCEAERARRANAGRA